MNVIVSWVRQPTTIVGIGVLIGAAAYWGTGDAKIAATAFGAVCMGMQDHSSDVAKAAEILTSVEKLEDGYRKPK